MVFEGVQAVTVGVNSVSDWHNILGGLTSHTHFDWVVLAQEVNDPNVLARMQSAWNHFIKTGQVWAMLIGFVIGYLFRNMTSF